MRVNKGLSGMSIGVAAMIAIATISTISSAQADDSDNKKVEKKDLVKARDAHTRGYDAKKAGVNAKADALSDEKNVDGDATTKGGAVTADQAKKIVEGRKEVKEFFALFDKAKKQKRKVGKPVLEVERDGTNWLVHVYEQLPDHTATMNWYTVNGKTGAVSLMF